MQRAAMLFRQGRLAEAADLCLAVLAVRPDDAEALHLLGLVKFAGGAFDEALHLIEAAVHAGVPSPQMLLNRGLVLNAMGRPTDAIASFAQAIALDANFTEAHNNRAVLLAALGRHQEALEGYRHALRIAPQDARTLYNHANALKELGRREEALAGYDAALAKRPNYAEALCNRGSVLHDMKRFDQALDSFDRALALRPDIAEAHSNRGNVLRDLRRFEEALESYDRAIAMRPDYAEALGNRGTVLHDLKRFGQALADFDRALALRPNYASAVNNRGLTLKELKRFDEAQACHDSVLATRADDVEAHWNESLLQLLLGNYARGWPKYEWRWQREPGIRLRRDFAQPLWLGEGPIDGRTILIHSEQGLGDAIQFCRYIPLLAARGARVIFEVQASLQTLMRGLAGVAEVVVSGTPLPPFDCHCPLLTLPLAFRTRLETIPAEIPYLHASAPAAQAWCARLGPKGPRHRSRIGLVWCGNPDHKNDQNRSMRLRELLPLLDIDATFISLQKSARPDDAAMLADRSEILQVGEALTDFADTAALVSQLDLVISVDTSVAHLAGALGKPVWLLATHIPDWRWLLDRDDSPWYPSVRLFRQSEVRRWDEVILRLRAAALEFVQGLR